MTGNEGIAPQEGRPHIEGVDPELMALPKAPDTRRFLTVAWMAMVGAIAVLLGLSRVGDLQYALSEQAAVELGEVTALAPGLALPEGQFVAVDGLASISRAVRYRRMFGDAEYVVFPLAGQPRVFVRLETDGARAFGDDVPTHFSGRLVPFSQLDGRFAALEAALARSTGAPLPDDALLLLGDEPPGDPAGPLMFILFCAGVLLTDAWLIARWFKPLPAWAEDLD